VAGISIVIPVVRVDHAVSNRAGKDVADFQHDIVPISQNWWFRVDIDAVHADPLVW